MMGNHRYPSFDLFSDPPPPNLTEFQSKYVRNFSWNASPLGPVQHWPTQLRQFVNMSQRDLHASCIYWDIPSDSDVPDVAIVYNEAYTYLIGRKHPSLQGSDPKHGFSEIWDQFSALLEKARLDGITVTDKNAFLLLERWGFTEECYFSWKFIPIIGENGSVVGSYATVVESTEEVLSARRLATIHQLGNAITFSVPYSGDWKQILVGLEGNEKDIPLALLYSVVNRRSSLPLTEENVVGCDCYFEGALGVDRNHPVSPDLVNLDPDNQDGWARAFKKSIEGEGHCLLVELDDPILPLGFFDGISWRGFGASNKVAICPIRSSTTSSVLGILVIAINPRRPFDKEYNAWIELLVKSVATPHAEAVFAAADKAKLSERLRLQAKDLAESEKKFRTFAQFSTTGIMITTPSGKLLFGNQAWFDLIGGEPTERDQYYNAIHPDDQAVRDKMWLQMIHNKSPINYQLRFNRPWKPPQSLAPDAEETCTYTLVSGWPDLDADGNVQSIMATVTDISEIKYIEDQLRQQTVEAEQRVKQQEAFVDMVSHEIRNPLSAILHCADEISQALDQQMGELMVSNETHNILQAADTIVYCAMHQKRIVDDVLTLSKLDSNFLEVSPQRVEPIELVQTALRIFESELKKLEMKLDFVVDQSIRALKIHWLLFDSNRFLQVLVNLMTNAVKFTREQTRKEIKVILSASLESPLDAEGDLIYVPSQERRSTSNTAWQDWPPDDVVFLSCSVEDTGKGITSNELKTLFHRFSQASPKTQVQYGGSGLGLYISRQLSEIQGGKIGVKSDPGEGTTFTFFIRTCRTIEPGSQEMKTHPQLVLDFERVKEEMPDACGSGIGLFDISPPGPKMIQPRDTEMKLHAGPGKSEKIHVLIVEDNLVNQKILARQLTKQGYHVSIANHGAECIDFLQNTTFWATPRSLATQLPNPNPSKKLDVILMDWEMPIMDGLTCVRKIRELEADGMLLGHVPVIAVTANARGQQIRVAREAGMDDIVTKPYRISEILLQVEAILRRFQASNGVDEIAKGAVVQEYQLP